MTITTNALQLLVDARTHRQVMRHLQSACAYGPSQEEGVTLTQGKCVDDCESWACAMAVEGDSLVVSFLNARMQYAEVTVTAEAYERLFLKYSHEYATV